MKSQLLNILLVMLAAVAFSGCRELALDGDLAGQWQILSIEHPDGSTTDPQGRNYYCFYRDVAQLTNTNTTRISANMLYNESAGLITLNFPYDNISTLSPWGITETDPVTSPSDSIATLPTVTLKINHLTASRLTMTAPGGNIITCRKY